MTTRVPPGPAIWLLARLGGDARFEPLIGDLAEEFAAGRSRLWYWRQATGALGLNLLRILKRHARSFIGAVLTGCVVNALWVRGSSYAFRPVYANLAAVHGHPWTAQGLFRVAGMQLNGISNTALAFASVWLVTRVHRAHRRAVLLAFVVAVAVQRLPDIARLVVNTGSRSLAPVSWAAVLVPMGLQATFTLAVGLWMIRAERFAEMPLKTRVAVLFASALAVLVALVYHARLIGALPFSRPEWYALDALDITSVAYLACLWWQPTRPHPLCNGAK